MNRKPLILFIGLILFSCLIDIITFFYAGSQIGFAYEINPLIVILKLAIPMWLSVTITVLWKLFINFGLIYLLWNYNPKRSHFFAYFLVYGAMFALLIQGVGAFSNLYTSNLISTAPVDNVPQPVNAETALLIGKVLSIAYYTFLGFSLLSFWIYERIYRVLPPKVKPK